MQTTLPELPADEPNKDLEEGHKVGEYVIEGKLGAGGFGTVFRASHPVIGKLVAIKVLNRQFSVQREMVSRFVAEARAVNQIRHRNIIDIFGFGTLEDGRHYYVMELLDGVTLGEYLEREGRLGLREALPILRAVGKALDAAHAKGIAHRDLKPENIYLATDPDGGFFPKLLDFGIAKLLVADEDAGTKGAHHKTRTGAPIGTPLYMSPEQCRGRDVDHRTDIYAFGIVAFRMLTGKMPFDADDYMTILMQQMGDPPPLPSSLVAELPAGIDRAITWMLAKEPAQRPGSLIKAMEALEQAAAEVGVASPTWNATPPPGALRAAEAGPDARGSGVPPPASSLRGEGGPLGQPPGRGQALGTAATLDSSQLTVPAISGARNTTPDVETPSHAERGQRGGRTRVKGIIGGGLAVAAAATAFLIVRGGDGERSAATTPAPVVTTVAPDLAATRAAAAPDLAPTRRTEPTEPPGADDSVSTEAATVRLTFTGLPDSAVVFDAAHQALGLAKQGIALPRSSQPITLTFEVDGRVVAKKQLVPEASAELAVELARAEATQRKPRPRSDRDKPRPSPTAADPNSTERPPGL
jgi:eukaryotic-like serine/threonine-protein kinase